VRLSADRLTAARLLIRIEDGAFSSRLLSAGVAPAVRVRVLEVLRSLRALDVVIQRSCRRKIAKLDPEVRAALRLGLAENMNLDVPAPLATDGAVRLVRRLGRSSAASMVNAVLRKATSEWPQVLDRSSHDVRFSHPEWLYHRWQETFGREAAVAAMASAQEPATTWVWFLDEGLRGRFADEAIALEPHPWCAGAWTAPGNAGRLIEKVEEGAAYAQDPSSQVVSHVACSLAPEKGSLLDLCAAPGGKTALLLHLDQWASFASCDLRLNRARLMLPLVERVGGCPVLVADVMQPPFSEGGWDLVLLDGPCSGTGTLRRHPELKWRLEPESILNLVVKQRDLLAGAVPLVKPGGSLLYTTCSIETEENEGVVAGPPAGYEIEDLEPHVPENVPWIPTSAGGIRILPNPFGDGFTMHAIRRVG
jgi:16S rRNA (cytosine967-C5)-methyltransferase